MSKKYSIQVRDEKGTVVEIIKQVLRAEQIGNFNPFFCTYKGNKRCLINSDEGDVSDPFRREESYAASFYITVKKAEQTEQTGPAKSSETSGPLEITISLESAYSLALNSAEQGGIFSALNFKKLYPNAEAFRGTWSERNNQK